MKLSALLLEQIEATPKFKTVMKEYGKGKLKTSTGKKVKNPKQAVAIAASESGQSEK
jgi:hypothetical protein